MRPGDVGNWITVDRDLRRGRPQGGWHRVLTKRRYLERRRQGRQAEPSAGRIDSQRIKTVTQGLHGGFDGGHHVNGRKRHLRVTPSRQLVEGVVTAANPEDRVGRVEWMTRSVAPGVTRLRKLGVDQGSRAPWLTPWVREWNQTHQMALDMTASPGKGVEGVAWRGVAGRPFAWLLHDRRHRRDDDVRTVKSEAMIEISMSRLLLKRLAR